MLYRGPIISSILDTDVYKLTMQNAIMQTFRDVNVTYKFIDRNNQKYPRGFTDALRDQINSMRQLYLTDDELEFLKSIDYLNDPIYLEFLKGYRFNPEEVTINKYNTNDGNERFDLYISGPWYRTVLWETPILATISELFNYMVNQVNIFNTNIGRVNQFEILPAKIADFGTRRRNCYQYHDQVIERMVQNNNFVGTSNVYLAMKHNTTPIGTFAHEWVSGNAALLGYKHGNRHAMENWVKVYRGRLGIALTDTFGLDTFLRDFDIMYTKLFDGVRHDSGSATEFADRMVEHYQKCGIDPKTKTIIFSDSLYPDKIEQLYNYCQNIGIGCAFGVGTKLTNGPFTSALNIVMKLIKINDEHVIKMPDESGKNTGDTYTIKAVNYLLYGNK